MFLEPGKNLNLFGKVLNFILFLSAGAHTRYLPFFQIGIEYPKILMTIHCITILHEQAMPILLSTLNVRDFTASPYVYLEYELFTL